MQFIQQSGSIFSANQQCWLEKYLRTVSMGKKNERDKHLLRLLDFVSSAELNALDIYSKDR
jgi:hypothetical protein